MKKNHLIYVMLAVLVCLLPNLAANNYVIINQVMYDTPLNERVAYPPYSNGEYIELYNGRDEAVSLEQWYIKGNSPTEIVYFPQISIAPKGYLLVVFRHVDSPSFVVDTMYSLPLTNPKFQYIYQNNVILANEGETISLYNFDHQLVDEIYYDGTSNSSSPNRLCAENTTGIHGDDCVSLHRTWVEFDENGYVVPGTSQWKTGKVTFASCQLAEPSFGEHYIMGSQSLPESENYVLSVTPLDPTTRISLNNGQISVSNGVRTRTTIQYFDGIGRLDEVIALDVTPDDKDLVFVTDYHGKQKVARQWLPIVAESEGQHMDIASVRSQAQTDYSDNHPYYETTYENSAIGRQIAQAKPGTIYNSHKATQTYDFNSANEVRMYTVNTSGALRTDGSYYAACTLYKNSTTDEDGKSVTVYTDKQGRKILEDRDGNHSYYVYDDLGRLRFMIPNLPSTKLTNGTYPLSNPTLKAIAYCYKYDARGNLIYKRLPGCEPQRMVYDQTGQLILKQDGNQHLQDKWTLYAYDSIGRNVYTAELPLPQDHEYYLSLFEDMWYVEHYGDNPAAYSFAGTGYASTVLGKNGLRLLTVNYYDHYDFLKRRLTTEVRQHLRYKQESGCGLQHDCAVGLLTGTLVYNLSETGYTANSYYYDTNGRVVQTRCICSNDEYKSATSSEYHFDGTTARQLTIKDVGGDSFLEHYRYTYDRAGRAKKTSYQFNNGDEITLSEYSYDSLGHLVRNLLYNRQDTIMYTFDMRSMLTETHNRHFTERLFYADNLPQSVVPCYNGSIAALRIEQMDSIFTFAYTYDACNRLKKSNRLTGSGTMLSESFDYDDSGNIVHLKRYKNNQPIDDLVYDYGDIGHQVYAIIDHGIDADQYSTIEYHNGINQPDTTMHYDANGNLVYDSDRGITFMRYNILNLPDTIQFNNGNQIINMYDATGRKYKSITYTLPATAFAPIYEIAHYNFNIDTIHYDVMEYSGNIERHYSRYDTTHRVFNTIGYCQKDTFFYALKDHLGNTSVIVNATTQLPVQSTVYYASGVPMAQSFGREKQPYLYNGKEFIESHGYNTFDYGFRGYYAPVGRFTTMDPLAEQTPWQSPYSYAGNNFINAIDWMGLAAKTNLKTQGGSCQYIVVDNEGYIIGGENDDDMSIYLDEDGEWSLEEGKAGLTKIGWMILPFRSYFREVCTNGRYKAPGIYFGQWNLIFSASIGLSFQEKVNIASKEIEIGINMVSFELVEVSVNNDWEHLFEWDYVGKNNRTKVSYGFGIGVLEYEKSFEVSSTTLEYIYRTEQDNFKCIFNSEHLSMTMLETGNLYMSLSYGSFVTLTISILGNIYYQNENQ